ncbi:hypothetical protein ACFVS2_20225 [Brevibacillus sp. NPDC058079]|uniref:hypothetical protein n=1 Tax=Brevibacillus sp. NPDC058079 TaxID=3346330 RepID=UPI0036EEC379
MDSLDSVFLREKTLLLIESDNVFFTSKISEGIKLKHFYLNSIYGKKRKHPDLYKTLQREVFGKELTWKQMQEQEKEKLLPFMCELEERILIHESPIDIEKMTKAILFSRSGVGGTAMTKYSCAFCGTEEYWGNTAVPGICRSCAEKMAKQIAKYTPDVLKT